MTSNCFSKAYSCAFKKSLISILKIWYYVWDSHDFGWFFATRIRIRIVDTNATISKSVSLLRKLSKNDIKQINHFNKKKYWSVWKTQCFITIQIRRFNLSYKENYLYLLTSFLLAFVFFHLFWSLGRETVPPPELSKKACTTFQDLNRLFVRVWSKYVSKLK